jgi:hypothetical protein
MNEELWSKFDKLRGSPFSGADGLPEFFQREGIRFAPRDLATWSRFIAARLGKGGGTFALPGWLAAVMVKLAEAAVPRSVCDPWAGIGFLVEILREACKAEIAVALTQVQVDHALGSVLVPDVQWHLSEPLGWLAANKAEFDVVASILPMGARSAHPLQVRSATGVKLELAGDLGNQVMVAASLHLRSTGVGLFVVPQSFFLSRSSVVRRFDEIGLNVQAALSLPAGTFAPYTNIPAHLLIVRRGPQQRMFVAQLSSDEKANLQVLQNLQEEQESTTPEMGRFVHLASFTSFEALKAAAKFAEAEGSFGTRASRLEDLATAINLGRPGAEFEFAAHGNALFIPLIGNNEVVDSAEGLKLRKQNYAQVCIDPARSSAQFVARFLNSDFGIEIREHAKAGAVVPRLTKQSLAELPVFVPDLNVQRLLLNLEARIAGEQNTLLGLQNELTEYRRELWRTPATSVAVERGLDALSKRLSGGLREHAAARLDQWFETLPFPLASILRAWQATPSQDFRAKYEHLLHFFEATAEFASVVLLSAFGSNEALFAPHRQRLVEVMQRQNLSFQRATFGAWKLVVEYLGKQTRELLSVEGERQEVSKDGRELCAQVFSDPSLCLPATLSRKDFAQVLATTNKMRNDWLGHSGVVSAQDAQLRNEQLLGELQKLREVQADLWEQVQLICGLYCQPRSGLFENEVAVLMGSNSEFLKEKREMATWLDVDSLYLWNKGSAHALRLMPLIRIGASPQSAKNACYFFSRLERGGARFVSYHFTDMPELTGQFGEATDAIKRLMQP